MNIPLMTMPKSVAREAFLTYKRALDRRAGTAGDETVMECYRQMSRGRTLLELNTVMQAAGVDDQQRPILAIARADAPRVEFGWGSGWHPTFNSIWAKWHRRQGLVSFKLDWQKVHFGMSNERRKRINCRAIVPTIPPHLRPRHAVIHKYAILWEADWQAAPVDPILLSPVTGSIYAVVAQWDLTEVERMVLGLGS